MAHLDGSLSWQGCWLRTGCSAAPSAVAVASTAGRSDLAKAQARKGGQFTSSKFAAERKRKHRDNKEILQDKLEQQIAKHKEEVTILKATSIASLQKLTAQLAVKETLIRSLKSQEYCKGHYPSRHKH
jgi:septal ring factor EnvC (AmiA/AmiB activator)